jgi:hypothetical protein
VVRPARSFFCLLLRDPATVSISGLPCIEVICKTSASCAQIAEAGEVMDGQQLTAVHRALVAVQEQVVTMTFPSCDQEDLLELIDRIEGELHAAHPNLPLMCTFLNSIARSLRAQPEARGACLTIEEAIGAAGMPSTWQSGI